MYYFDPLVTLPTVVYGTTSHITLVTSVGADVTLPCRRTNSPEWKEPSDQGHFNSEENEDTSNTSIESKKTSLSWANNSHDLVIANITEEDEGIYTCFSTSFRSPISLHLIVLGKVI